MSRDSEVEGDTFLRNVGRNVYKETASRPRRPESSLLNLLAILRNCWRQEATSAFIGLQSIKATEISARIPTQYFTIKLYIPSAGSVQRCVFFLLRPFHFLRAVLRGGYQSKLC